MVADKLVRDRMVYEGRIIEGVTVVPGTGTPSCPDP